MRIVLDTASLIAGLRSSQGAAAKIIRLILLGTVSVLMDYKLSLEYRDVGLRAQHLAASGLTKSQVLDVIVALEAVAEAVLVFTRERPLSTDPDDDMILDIAINGRADAIVTTNRKHFVAPAKRFGIAVLSPLELLMVLEERHSHGS